METHVKTHLYDTTIYVEKETISPDLRYYKVKEVFKTLKELTEGEIRHLLRCENIDISIADAESLRKCAYGYIFAIGAKPHVLSSNDCFS